MKHQQLLFVFLFICLSIHMVAQDSFDSPMAQVKMKKDLDLFYKLREAANSGVYKYRTKQEIDSIYQWAYTQITQSATFGDFYGILCQITDFEGSLHNVTQLPTKIKEQLETETSGYFPFTIKLIDGKWVCNNRNMPVPLGSEILSINDVPMNEIIPALYKYYTTDGYNISGKKIGLNALFPHYYRMNFGQKKSFQIQYISANNSPKQAEIPSISNKQFRANFTKRHSKKIDYLDYASDEELIENEVFYYSKILNDSTAMLVVNSFSIGGNAASETHKAYVRFLEKTFAEFKEKAVKHLIVDVRYNGGGTDPNDLVTYSFLTQRNFQENTEAWISFQKIPYWSRIKGELFFLIKPIAKLVFQKELKEIFYVEKEGKYYQGDKSNDHKVWSPNPNAFEGQIYLLVGPRIASAGSLFASLLASDESTITIGEETMGTYHGHNGHTPIRYQLKHSKIKTAWSIVNLEQDVRAKPNQPVGYGIIPNYEVKQSHNDFLNNKDTVMQFVLDFIETSQ